MRNISKLFSAALMLILAAACNTKEIDYPENPNNPDKPKAYDNIILTAGINQTRVDYTVNGTKLVPDWEKDDVIFGFYGSGDGNKIEFTVEDVKDDGTAVLKPVIGWDGFLDQFKGLQNDEKLQIGLMYTGSTASYSLENSNAVIVSMTSQTGEKIPACMHASSYQVVKDDEDDDTQIIRFFFDNDCAIFEIESITGIAEDAGLGEDETLALTSLTVTNLIPTYEYSYASGKLSGKSGTGDPTSYTITLPENTWKVDYEGNINRTDAKNLLVAVAPNSENNILITATATDGNQSREFSYLYNGKLEAGQCYMIKKRDVVARTSDGQYFTTVKAAFDRAKELSEDNSGNFNTAATNIVTLLADIFGLGTTDSGWWKNNDSEDGEYNVETIIDIDYPVSFNLNGYWLDLGYDGGIETTGGFRVKEGGCLNVTDNTGEGAIYSSSSCPMIENSGTVNILNGFFEMYGEETSNKPLIKNSNILNVFGGELLGMQAVTIECTGGTLTVGNEDSQTKKDDEIKISAEYQIISAIICSGGTFYMNYGNIEGDTGVSAIVLNNGAVGNISGGTLNAKAAPTIIFTDTETRGIITGGVISNLCSKDKFSFDTIHVLDGADCKISGGAICGESDSAGAVLCVSSSTDHPSTLTVTWPDDISDPSPETIPEPIFYSKGKNNSAVPICAYYLDVDNTAKLIINGGYLISSNPLGLFYIDDDKNTDLDNLCVKDENSNVVFGNFYSNVSKINKDGSNFNQNDFIDFKSVTISEIQFMGSQYKDYEKDEPSEKYGSIRLPFSDTPEFIGDLYKIFSYSETP